MLHKINDKCNIEFWISKSNESIFLPCIITDIVDSMDMEYRLNVILEDGTELKECSPECVIKI